MMRLLLASALLACSPVSEYEREAAKAEWHDRYQRYEQACRHAGGVIVVERYKSCPGHGWCPPDYREPYYCAR